MDKHDRTISRHWPAPGPVYVNFERIMYQEMLMNNFPSQYVSAEEAYNSAKQILKTANLNLTLRSFNGRYNDYDKEYAPESVGGHANLTLAIANRELRYLYGPNYSKTEDGYTSQEITEAIQRHDQPEEETGDIADNGNRDERAKLEKEEEYLNDFSQLSPPREQLFEDRVNCLLHDMNRKLSYTGRILFACDKVAADIIALAYDRAGFYLVVDPTDKTLSKRDRAEIEICEYSLNGKRYASEMWATDYFKIRNLARYDDYGYCTALLIMCTLLVNDNHWYSWREADYVASPK